MQQVLKRIGGFADKEEVQVLHGTVDELLRPEVEKKSQTFEQLRADLKRLVAAEDGAEGCVFPVRRILFPPLIFLKTPFF